MRSNPIRLFSFLLSTCIRYDVPTHALVNMNIWTLPCILSSWIAGCFKKAKKQYGWGLLKQPESTCLARILDPSLAYVLAHLKPRWSGSPEKTSSTFVTSVASLEKTSSTNATGARSMRRRISSCESLWLYLYSQRARGSLLSWFVLLGLSEFMTATGNLWVEQWVVRK
jgi:hypothetical protein